MAIHSLEDAHAAVWSFSRRTAFLFVMRMKASCKGLLPSFHAVIFHCLRLGMCQYPYYLYLYLSSPVGYLSLIMTLPGEAESLKFACSPKPGQSSRLLLFLRLCATCWPSGCPRRFSNLMPHWLSGITAESVNMVRCATAKGISKLLICMHRADC